MPTLLELYGELQEATLEDLIEMEEHRRKYSRGGWYVGGLITKDYFKNSQVKTSPHSKEAPTQSAKSTEPSKKNE